MAEARPILEGLNLIVRDVEAAVAFYRRLGLKIRESAIWRTESGAHHVEIPMPGGLNLDLDSQQLAKSYNAGWSPGGARSVIGFSLPTREAVDERYTELTRAGYKGLQPPYDTFWGARLIRGLLRRGTGTRYERSFWIQRAPQLAIATSLLLVMVAFEAIELRLGSGDPSFGHALFESLGVALPLISLALVLPTGWAASIAWAGILVVLAGILFLLGGLYTMSGSFSTDAEVLHGHEL
jgi:catechol 2,3-dioxygenase-like lactoylglutathione lyase family enzyme